MTNAINQNGRPPRKSLAAQLDRMDAIIDTLGDGLNEAVAEVVRHAVTVAVQQAVETVMREVLARPELLRTLVGPSAEQNQPSQTPDQGKRSRLKRAWGWFWMKTVTVCAAIKEQAHRLASRIGTKLSNARRTLGEMARGLFPGMREATRRLWLLRRPITLSLVIGLAAGGIGIAAGPVISSVLLGLAASALSMTGFVVLPLVRLMRAMQVGR